MDLYYSPECPHCHRVITWIEGHGLTDRFNYIDVLASQTAVDKLQKVSRSGSVPCLVTDDDKVILGDDKILEYLQALYA